VVLTVHRRQYVEIKCQLDTTEVFIADLIACSTCFGHPYAHHQELKSIIQWLLPVVFCAVWTSVVCRQIVIDVGDMPHCFLLDISGHEILHRFLHEGQ